MTPKQLADYIRFSTKTDKITFPDREILALVNTYKDDFAEEIIKVNEDIFVVPATTDLVAGQREYSLPDNLVGNFKRVEAKFKPETDEQIVNGETNDWIILDEIDLNDTNKPSSEKDILAQYSNEQGQARFEIMRDAYYIYSGEILDVSPGLKVYYSVYPFEITSLESTQDMSIPNSTVHVGIPKPFHLLLATRVCIAYKESKEKPIPLNQTEQKFEYDFAQAIETISNPNLDRSIIRGYKVESPLLPTADNGFNF